MHEGKLVAVKNYIHSIEKLKQIAGQLRLTVIRFAEKLIDDSMKEYYEKKNALHLFEKFKGVPIIYSIHLKKSDDPA
jgi:hypothetical protein